MKIGETEKTYGGKKVLSVPSFSFENGKIYALLGANGSGKSTFAKILAGLEKPDEGPVFVGKAPSVGYMPQKSFPFRMSVKKNILLNGGDERKAETLINALSLSGIADRNAKRLSGGELAKTALARIMMRHYDLLILDEPCASMDMASTVLAEKLIKEYCRGENAAVLLITHSLAQARRTADLALFLRGGTLTEAGSAEKVLYAPEKEETKLFLDFYG